MASLGQKLTLISTVLNLGARARLAIEKRRLRQILADRQENSTGWNSEPVKEILPRDPDTVDENAGAAWQEEIVRRLEQVRSGKVKTTSWNDVRQKGRSPLHNN